MKRARRIWRNRDDDLSWFGNVIEALKICCIGISDSNDTPKELLGNVVLNLPCTSGDTKRPDNTICTAKYKWWDFFPRATALQFRRFTNTFFLIIAIIGTIGHFVPNAYAVSYTPWGTLMILAFVIGITLVFEGRDDIYRHQADRATNHIQTRTFNATSKNYETHSWGDLRPGNIIRIENDELVPADVLLLNTAKENKTCYIETSGIDGETNLKMKSVGTEMKPFIQACSSYNDLSGRLVYEEPNAFLQFSGRFEPDEAMYNKVNVKEMDSEKSSVNVDQFAIGSNAIPLDYHQLILRGSCIKNTKYIEALVVYSGEETKLVLSSSNTPSKFSILDSFVNRMMGYTMVMYFVVVISMVIVLLAAVPSTSNMWYFAYTSTVDAYLLPGWFAFFLTFLGLFAMMIPIDMYVCLELANFVQSLYVSFDKYMYHAETDTRAQIKTGNLVAEIGQVTHVFSDKTGTLTRNEMRLVGLQIGTTSYGYNPTAKEPNPPNLPIKAQFSKLIYDLHRDPTSTDGSKLRDMMLILALCHSVVIDNDNEGKIRYNAEGPDEEALVEAAADIGFRLISSADKMYTFENKSTNKTESYRILAINAFTSDRKRMSVIAELVEPSQAKKDDIETTETDSKPIETESPSTETESPSNGIENDRKIYVFVKGADNVVLERCVIDNTQVHDAVQNQLGNYSSHGLRTLVMAKRRIAVEEFERWKNEFAEASNLTGISKLDALAKAAETIENGLELVGASAIEDALQEGVPDTIATLKDAGIKVWVLTGDKVETAINIGFSSKLLDRSMKLIQFQGKENMSSVFKDMDNMLQLLSEAEDGHIVDIPGVEKAMNDKSEENPLDSDAIDVRDDEDVDSLSSDGLLDDQLRKRRDSSVYAEKLLHESWTASTLALVISGDALEYFLRAQKGTHEREEKFLALASKCAVVLACRVSPKQKALLVEVVSSSPKRFSGVRIPVTLAIGDGANDVPMIQEARIGVGISGKEGLQAANNSDFAIAQFRYLRRLLLVHGRWNYLRSSAMVTYVGYCWQVTAYQVFFYLWFSLHSGQTVFYNSYYMTLYAWIVNSVIVAISWFNRDIDQDTALQVPQCYSVSRTNTGLNEKAVIMTSSRAFLHAFLIFGTQAMVSPEYSSTAELGASVYCCIVLVMNARQFMIANTYNWFIWFAFALVFFLFLSMVAVIDIASETIALIFQPDFVRVWLGGIWLIGALVLIDLVCFGIPIVYNPTANDLLVELDHTDQIKKKGGLYSSAIQTDRSQEQANMRVASALLRASKSVKSMRDLTHHSGYDYSYADKS